MGGARALLERLSGFKTKIPRRALTHARASVKVVVSSAALWFVFNRGGLAVGGCRAAHHRDGADPIAVRDSGPCAAKERHRPSAPHRGRAPLCPSRRAVPAGKRFERRGVGIARHPDLHVFLAVSPINDAGRKTLTVPTENSMLRKIITFYRIANGGAESSDPTIGSASPTRSGEHDKHSGAFGVAIAGGTAYPHSERVHARSE